MEKSFCKPSLTKVPWVTLFLASQALTHRHGGDWPQQRENTQKGREKGQHREARAEQGNFQQVQKQEREMWKSTEWAWTVVEGRKAHENILAEKQSLRYSRLGSEKMQTPKDDRRGQMEWKRNEEDTKLSLPHSALRPWGAPASCVFQLSLHVSCFQLVSAGHWQGIAEQKGTSQRVSPPPSASCTTHGTDSLSHASKIPARLPMVLVSRGRIPVCRLDNPSCSLSLLQPVGCLNWLVLAHKSGLLNIQEFWELVVKLLLAWKWPVLHRRKAFSLGERVAGAPQPPGFLRPPVLGLPHCSLLGFYASFHHHVTNSLYYILF